MPVAGSDSLKVAPVPARPVHTENAGPGALAQLYVGPEEAGVPVVAATVLEIFTVPPGQMPDPVIVPGLCVVEYTASVVLLELELHVGLFT